MRPKTPPEVVQKIINIALQDTKRTLSASKIASLVNVSRKTVQRILAKNNISLQANKKDIIEVADNEVAKKPEKSARTLSKDFNLSPTTIRKKCKHYVKKSNALSSEEIEEIIATYSRYKSIKKTAKVLGRCPKTIKKYLSR